MGATSMTSVDMIESYIQEYLAHGLVEEALALMWVRMVKSDR